jgi:hypothetical protein
MPDRSLTAAGAAIGEIGRDLSADLTDRMLNAASFAIKQDGLRIAGAVSGGDRRLSRFGGGKVKGRTRMGIGYDITGTRSEIRLRPAALWSLTTGGSRPHPIGAGRRTRAGGYTKGRKGRRVLVLPAAVQSAGRRSPSRVRPAPVQHPGTAGRGAMIALYASVPGIVDREFPRILIERIGKV